MKAIVFKADVPKQRMTEALLNLDKVKRLVHYFDDKNVEVVHILWDDGIEETVYDSTAKNMWIAANDNGAQGGRRN